VNWWQIVLIILGSISLGLGVGYLLNYLIVTITARLRKRAASQPQAAAVIRELPKAMESPKATAPLKPAEPPKATESPKATAPLKPAEPPKAMESPRTTVPPKATEPPKATVPPKPMEPLKATEPPKATAPPKATEPPKATVPPKTTEPPKTTIPDLFDEIENNRRIASQTGSGNLQAFPTKVWDTKRDEVNSLPTELREELTQAYSDMTLANSIVWLATEMGRRSSSLDESYLKLCTGIADRLNRLKPSIEQLRLR
jgi:hypothetical protein